MRKLTVVLILAVSSFLLACKSPSSTGHHTTPVKGDVVDCNYFWAARSRHVCIKDMPRKECAELFQAGGFSMEKQCVCDQAGKQKTQVEGTGYTQYDCN